MSSTNAGNLAKGMYIMYKNAPHQVTKAEFMAPGKGSPIMRCRLKHTSTGRVEEFTFKTNEMVELADVEKFEMQYLYRDGENVVFIDPRNYEQTLVPVTLLEEQIGFLIPDMKCWVLLFNGEAIGITLPPHVNLKVTDAPEAIAGNRINSPKRNVMVETGIEIPAPLFIKTGDIITVDTTTGEYISRATQ